MQPEDIGKVSFDYFDISSEIPEPKALPLQCEGSGSPKHEGPSVKKDSREDSGLSETKKSNISSHRKAYLSTKRINVIVLFLSLSFLSHFFIIKAVYHLSVKDEINEPQENKVTLKIKPAEIQKEEIHKEEKSKKEEPAEPKEKTTPAPKAKKKPAKTIKANNNTEPKSEPKKFLAKGLSQEELAALGKKHIGKVREGRFPALILNYPSPIAYIREMYTLGAKTLIYAKADRKAFEINLLSEQILPFTAGEFEGFSFFKRVIAITGKEWTHPPPKMMPI